ncbi:restriction endonuclease subunit S [Flavobacterium sp. LB2R40]|uniref:restriction endonuclease subunit S n=1 Tax=Flavobacterium sp. LB2R40 TaxID=3401722 RepID=UPI003AAA98C8
MSENIEYIKTSVGLIPSDWKLIKFEDLFDFKNGINSSKEFYGDGVKFINVMEIIYNNSITIDKIKGSVTITEEQLVNYSVKKGDVLFNRTSETQKEIGLSAVYLSDEKVVFGGFVIRGISKNDILDLNFKKSCFLSKIVRDQIIKGGQGAVRTNIGQTDLEKILLPVPPLLEQQKIASIIDVWDVAIDNCTAIIENLKNRNKGLVNKLIIDNGELNVKLGNVFVESKIPTVDADVNKRITVRLTLKGIEKRGVRGSELEEATSYYLRKSGQFIYGKQNLHKGAFGIIPDELDGFESSSDIPAFDINKEFNSKYIFYYFSRRHFYEKLEDISTGTGSKRIQPKELYKVEIKVPSTLEKQNAIVKIIDTATDELTKYEQKLETLQVQKKGLMQQLLTGKTRVKI